MFLAEPNDMATLSARSIDDFQIFDCLNEARVSRGWWSSRARHVFKSFLARFERVVPLILVSISPDFWRVPNKIVFPNLFGSHSLHAAPCSVPIQHFRVKKKTLNPVVRARHFFFWLRLKKTGKIVYSSFVVNTE